MIKVTASIVIYNEEKETLKKVVDSFFALGFEKELIVVDNSPSDILREFCESFDDLHYIFSNENLGFGKGHNLAFQNFSINSDIHMIINPDTYFELDDINNFIQWFYSSENFSLAVPQVLNVDGTIQNVVRDIPTPISLIKRKLGINKSEISINDNEISEIPFAHGCFMVFKTDVFKKIDGFDERFFIYMEDVDIFIRAKKHGKTVINTNYKIYHEYRKASSKSFKLLIWHVVSSSKFFWKYRSSLV